MTYTRFLLSLTTLMLSFSYSFTVYESFIIQKKDNKKVLILGDLHVTTLAMASVLKSRDESERKITDDFIKKISGLESQFLLEACENDLKKFSSEMANEILKKGLYMGLPLFAIGNNYKYKNIKFKFADVRKDVLLAILEFFHLFNDHSLAFLKKNRDQIKKEQDYNYTFYEFFKEINFLLKEFELKNKKYDSDSVISNYIEKLISDAKNFQEIGFNQFGSDGNYYDVLMDIALNKGVESVADHCTNWILPLLSTLADIGFIINLLESLEKQDNVIIFSGNNHSIVVYNFLNILGYETIIAKGRQKEEEPITGEKFTELELKSFFAKALEVFSQKSCAICNSQKNLMVCSVCKNACYCSTDCQKKDWKNHKSVCKK